jgi:PBP1b-binding outer membrane lipoprotein LpoB
MASFIFALDSKYNGGIMKKALIILALITLLLPSCSSEKDAKIAELTTKIEQLTKEKAQDTFKKKI